MNFICEIKTNIEVGQKLYGIVCGSIYTWEGIYELTVEEISHYMIDGFNWKGTKWETEWNTR